MDIKKELTSAAVEAIKSLYGADVKAETIQLQKTKKEYEGQITLVVFPLLRILRRKPDVSAMSLMS
jgi:arginyl-tRNA synthetase